MSGGSRPDSGSSGSGFGGGTSDDCAIVESTVVNSPSAVVLPQITAGMTLAVESSTQNGRKILVAKTKAGVTVGSLTPRRLTDLLACIDRGNSYIAVVTSRTGGKCGVEIRPGSV